MAYGLKCYCCGLAYTTNEFFYCIECLQKLKMMFDNAEGVIEKPGHMNHCISCGEYENRRIVYVNDVTPICEMCVADELGRYTKADAKNSQNKD